MNTDVRNGRVGVMHDGSTTARCFFDADARLLPLCGTASELATTRAGDAVVAVVVFCCFAGGVAADVAVGCATTTLLLVAIAAGVVARAVLPFVAVGVGASARAIVRCFSLAPLSAARRIDDSDDDDDDDGACVGSPLVVFVVVDLLDFVSQSDFDIGSRSGANSALSLLLLSLR